MRKHNRLVATTIAVIGGALLFSLPRIASACNPNQISQIGATWSAHQADLGPCIGDVGTDQWGGLFQDFQNGIVEWYNYRGSAYATWGNISEAWFREYGGLAALGVPVTYSEEVLPDNPINYPSSLVNRFWHPSTNEYTYLVYTPPSEEDGNYCTDSLGLNVCEMWGSFGYYWAEGLVGRIGAPMSNVYQTDNGNHNRQDFALGYMTWNRANGDVCAYSEPFEFANGPWTLFFSSGGSGGC